MDNIDDFLESLSCWDTFLFHWKINTTQPHYQVILNDKINWNTDMIFLSISTIQIEKRKDFIKKRGLDNKTLVVIESWKVPFLKKKSCFDCNNIKNYNKYEIFWEYLEGKLIFQWKIPSNIMKEILDWVMISELISNKFKKNIK